MLRLMRNTVIVLLGGLLLAGGCGSESGGGGRPDLCLNCVDDVGLPDAGGTDVGHVDIKGWDLPPTDTGGHLIDLFFLHDTSEPLRLSAGGAVTLRIKAVDYTEDGPAVGAVVFLQLEGPANASGYLAATTVVTGQSGTADIRFEAGETAPASYTVRAMTAGARSEAQATIEVGEGATGSLRVNLGECAQMPLSNVVVRLVAGSRSSCGQFYAPNPFPNYEREVNGYIGGNVVFDDLAADQRYLIYALGYWGPDERLVAAGCIDGVLVQGDTQNVVTLDVCELCLQAAGVYDLVSRFDLRNAIPGEAGRIIDLITDAFYSPGDFLFDIIPLILDYVVGQIVGEIVEQILNLFQDYVAEWINDWVENNAPPWLQYIIQIGRDLTQIVADLELVGIMTVSKLGADCRTLSGEVNWTGLALYWRAGCPLNDDTCGERLELNLEDLASLDNEFPIDLINSLWFGGVINFNRLLIERHTVDLAYGRLILYVIQDLLLPVIPGGTCYVDDDCGEYSVCDGGSCEYHSLSDLAYGIVDCIGMGEAADGGLLGDLGISGEQVTEACQQALDLGVGFIINPIVSMVNGLALDSSLRMSGSATMWDDDNDLIVDHIDDGEWDGTVEVQTQQPEPLTFTGTWHATRRP